MDGTGASIDIHDNEVTHSVTTGGPDRPMAPEADGDTGEASQTAVTGDAHGGSGEARTPALGAAVEGDLGGAHATLGGDVPDMDIGSVPFSETPGTLFDHGPDGDLGGAASWGFASGLEAGAPAHFSAGGALDGDLGGAYAAPSSGFDAQAEFRFSNSSSGEGPRHASTGSDFTPITLQPSHGGGSGGPMDGNALWASGEVDDSRPESRASASDLPQLAHSGGDDPGSTPSLPSSSPASGSGAACTQGSLHRPEDLAIEEDHDVMFDLQGTGGSASPIHASAGGTFEQHNAVQGHGGSGEPSSQWAFADAPSSTSAPVPDISWPAVASSPVLAGDAESPFMNVAESSGTGGDFSAMSQFMPCGGGSGGPMDSPVMWPTAAGPGASESPLHASSPLVNAADGDDPGSTPSLPSAGPRASGLALAEDPGATPSSTERTLPAQSGGSEVVVHELPPAGSAASAEGMDTPQEDRSPGVPASGECPVVAGHQRAEASPQGGFAGFDDLRACSSDDPGGTPSVLPEAMTPVHPVDAPGDVGGFEADFGSGQPGDFGGVDADFGAFGGAALPQAAGFDAFNQVPAAVTAAEQPLQEAQVTSSASAGPPADFGSFDADFCSAGEKLSKEPSSEELAAPTLLHVDSASLAEIGQVPVEPAPAISPGFDAFSGAPALGAEQPPEEQKTSSGFSDAGGFSADFGAVGGADQQPMQGAGFEADFGDFEAQEASAAQQGLIADFGAFSGTQETTALDPVASEPLPSTPSAKTALPGFDASFGAVAPEAPQSSQAVAAAEGGFGADFGAFDSPVETVAPEERTTSATEGDFGCDFGAFGGPTATNPAAAAEGGFGADFGAFDSPAETPAPEERKAATPKGDFGVDFGAFGRPAETSEAAVAEEGFGADFGDFDSPVEASASEERKAPAPEGDFRADFDDCDVPAETTTTQSAAEEGFGANFNASNGSAETPDPEVTGASAPEGGFGADFGAFGGPTETSPAAVAEGSFGADFGAFGEPTETAAEAGNAAVPQDAGNAAVPQDAFSADFGAFGEPTEAAVEPGCASVTQQAFTADFGAFGETTETAADTNGAAPAQEGFAADFGAFGGGAAVENDSAAAPNGDFDSDFGDSGGSPARAGGTAVSSGVGSTTIAAAGFSADFDADFDDFEAAPGPPHVQAEEAAPVTSPAAPEASDEDDEFGEFGDFEETTPAQSAPESSPGLAPPGGFDSSSASTAEILEEVRTAAERWSEQVRSCEPCCSTLGPLGGGLQELEAELTAAATNWEDWLGGEDGSLPAEALELLANGISERAVPIIPFTALGLAAADAQPHSQQTSQVREAFFAALGQHMQLPPPKELQAAEASKAAQAMPGSLEIEGGGGMAAGASAELPAGGDNPENPDDVSAAFQSAPAGLPVSAAAEIAGPTSPPRPSTASAASGFSFGDGDWGMFAGGGTAAASEPAVSFGAFSDAQPATPFGAFSDAPPAVYDPFAAFSSFSGNSLGSNAHNSSSNSGMDLLSQTLGDFGLVDVPDAPPSAFTSSLPAPALSGGLSANTDLFGEAIVQTQEHPPKVKAFLESLPKLSHLYSTVIVT